MRVMVLPGLDGTGRLLAEFAEAICKTHDVTVIAYPEDMTSYERIVDWLLPCLPPEEYVIVAESFSGPAATRIALERPAHLRGVVFVATFLRAPVRLPIWSIRWLRNLPYFPHLVATFSGPLVFGRAKADMARATFRAVLRDLPFKTLVDRVGAVLRLEAPHRLSEIDVPCMYIQGARDRLVHSSHYSDFEGLCGPPVVIDAPHFLLQTKPKDAADQVIGFISDLK